MLKSKSFGKIFKKTIASTLAVIISISVFTVTNPLNFSVNASADAFSHTKVYVSDFSSDDSSTWKLSDSTATIADGKLSLTAATANSYSSAAVRAEEHKSQYVRAVFNTSDFSNSRPVVWARATLLETGNPESLVGYYLAFEGTNPPSPTLYKREKSGDTYKDTLLAYCGAITWDSNKEYTLEIDVTGNANATVITARVYKSASLALQGIQTYVDVTNPYTKGSAAVSLKATAANATGKFDKLEYYTTDNVNEIYYAQENGIKTGVSFAQHTALLKDTQYTLSVEVAEAEVYEPLVISYATTATNAGEHILIQPKDCVLTKKNGKNVYSYTFKLADQTTAPLTKYDYRYSANQLRTTPVFIGFRQSDANIIGNKYTNFQLRENKNDGTFGPNILVNGDFKLGLYGWSDNVNVDFNSSTGYSLWSDTASKNSSRIILDGPIIQTDMDNTYYKLTNDKELNITFMGGSVTSGHGASDTEKTSWRALTTQWFKDNFDATISAKNAAVGSTGSHMAVYNYSLVSEHKTDLLFIDSAINDFYLYNNQVDGMANPESADAYNNTLRNVESLIRNARRVNPNIDIVLVLTFDHWRLSDASNPSLQAMIDLSKKYQLPCVDLREPLKARATADGLAWNSEGLKLYRTEDDTDNIEQLYLKGDGVHPIDAGYKIFGDYITEMLDGYMTNAETNNASELKDYELTDQPMSASIIDNPMVIPANKIALSDGWTHNTSKNFSTISSKFGTTYTSGVVATETVGSKLTYKFIGTEFGIFVMTGPNYGQLYIEVDGVPYKQGANGNFADGIIELYRGNNDHRTQVIASGLSNTEHTVTIEARAGKNGNRVEIGAYFVNDGRDYRVTTTKGTTDDAINSADSLINGKTAAGRYGSAFAHLTDGINEIVSKGSNDWPYKFIYELDGIYEIEQVQVISGTNTQRIGEFEIYVSNSAETLFDTKNKKATVKGESVDWVVGGKGTVIDTVDFKYDYAEGMYFGIRLTKAYPGADMTVNQAACISEVLVKGTFVSEFPVTTIPTEYGSLTTTIGTTDDAIDSADSLINGKIPAESYGSAFAHFTDEKNELIETGLTHKLTYRLDGIYEIEQVQVIRGRDFSRIYGYEIYVSNSAENLFDTKNKKATVTGEEVNWLKKGTAIDTVDFKDDYAEGVYFGILLTQSYLDRYNLSVDISEVLVKGTFVSETPVTTLPTLPPHEVITTEYGILTTTKGTTDDAIDSSDSLIKGKIPSESYGSEFAHLTDGINELVSKGSNGWPYKLTYRLDGIYEIEQVQVISGTGPYSRIGEFEIYVSNSAETLFDRENKKATFTNGSINWMQNGRVSDTVDFKDDYAEGVYFGILLIKAYPGMTLSSGSPYPSADISEVLVKGTFISEAPEPTLPAPTVIPTEYGSLTTTKGTTDDAINSADSLINGKTAAESYGSAFAHFTDGTNKIVGKGSNGWPYKFTYKLDGIYEVEQVKVISGTNTQRIGKFEIYVSNSAETLFDSKNKKATVKGESVDWVVGGKGTVIDTVDFKDDYAEGMYFGISLVEAYPGADMTVNQASCISEVLVKGTKCNTVTVTAGNGGTVSPGQTVFETGKPVTITVTPDNGYKVDKVLVNGVVSQLTDGVYTFDGTAGQHTFDVTFTMIGDANNDGSLDDADLEVIKKHILGLKNADIKYADTDSDGDVDILDLVSANELQ